MSVPKEQICIRPLIQYAETKFQQGAGVREVIFASSNFRDKSKRLVNNISPQAKIVHEFGTSTPVLAGIVVFEAVRHHLGQKGVQIPSSLDILSHAVTAASLTPPTGDNNDAGNSGDDEAYKQAEQWADSQAMQQAFRRPGELPPDMRKEMEE